MAATRRTIAAPLALCWLALIVYASLYPFSGWRSQGVTPWAYLAAPWPRYWTGFDVWTNLLGYVPLGLLFALALARSGHTRLAWLLGLLGPALVSLLLEALQSYLPLRVPSLVDALLNAAGGALGGALALYLLRRRWITSWNRFRSAWLVDESVGGIAVLLLWPLALLYPTPVPYGLGQVWSLVLGALAAWLQDTPFERWVPEPVEALPMGQLLQVLVVALCLWAPTLLGYALLRGGRQRLVFAGLWLLLALAGGALSSALTWGPAHAWDGFTPPTWLGLVLAASLALLSLRLSHRAAAVLLLLALGLALGLLNGAPDSPYFAESLEEWEQGRFSRFHGLSQWLGWLWPYAALVIGLRLALRPPPEHYNAGA